MDWPLPELCSPSETIGFGNLGNIRRCKFRPRFQQRRNSFLAINFASLFQGMVAFEPFTISFERLGENHFAARNCAGCGRALPFLSLKIAQAQLGDADSVGFERLPNQLAPHADSGIIVS